MSSYLEHLRSMLMGQPAPALSNPLNSSPAYPYAPHGQSSFTDGLPYQSEAEQNLAAAAMREQAESHAMAAAKMAQYSHPGTVTAPPAQDLDALRQLLAAQARPDPYLTGPDNDRRVYPHMSK